MKISVDAYPLVPARADGISNYIRKVLSELLKLDKRNQYSFYALYDFDFDVAGYEKVVPDGPSPSRVISVLNTLWLFSRGVSHMKRTGMDVFMGTRQMIPPFSGRMKKLLVVYDLVWHYYPETMKTFNRVVLGSIGKSSIRSADHIISISDSTTQSLNEVMRVPLHKITTAYPASDGYGCLDRGASSEHIARKFNVSQNYALTVGTVEPRKNLVTLLKAFAEIGDIGLQLLICGSSGWKSTSLRDEYRRLGLNEKRVKFLNYVQNEDMNMLYSGASMFLLPSLYEGFSIPVLEAMSSGTPVIMTPSCGVSGLVGEAAFMLSPEDVNAWAQAITSLATDNDRREKMVNRGLVIANNITWEKTASKVLEAIDELR